jgi:UDP-glucose 4-epimerase
MKILVAGVAGFIGSNLCRKLLEERHQVIGIDNLSYGFERNMAAYSKNKNFNFIYADITDPAVLKDHKVDVIVHLASQKIPRYTNALRTLDENYLMLKNIINKCIIDKSKIVFASTSDVYGKNSDIPFHENSDLVMGPTTIKRWAYALSKIYGEQLIIANHDENNLEYTITRFFGSYGPNQNLSWWGGPQSVFISRAFNKEPIEIHGDGEQKRTFTYVEDTVEGLYKCITGEKASNQIFNISAGIECEISIKDLGSLIWSMINGNDSAPEFNFIPYKSFGQYEDVMRRVADISKINSILGFSPQYGLREGLRKTIEWQAGLNTLQ